MFALTRAISRSATCLTLLLSGLAGAGEAATVYVEDTRVIPRQSSCYYYYCYTVDPILLDMDGNGTDDIWIRGYSSSSSSGSSSNLRIEGRAGTLIESGPMHSAGDVIDANLTYLTSVVPASYRYSRRSWGRSSRSYGGTWDDNTNTLRRGFIGVALTGGRYGWLELEIYGSGSGSLLAWGYETEAGTGIAAGALQTFVASADAPAVPLPASGLLLLGAVSGLALRRRTRH